ncbi:MAG: hypothetical protein IPK79_08500 [Vampirovibrionales bacterium]|nr:hypothetical protein [Vampirovibrionales bacterium]
MTLAGAFPFTSMLAPTSATRLAYLMTAGFITRMGMSAARVYQNRPQANHNPNYTAVDKEAARVERVFVEFPATLSFIVGSHTVMDLFSNWFQGRVKLHLTPQDAPGVNAETLKTVNQTIWKALGETRKQLLYRVMNENDRVSPKRIQEALAKAGIDLEAKTPLAQVLRPAVENISVRLRKGAAVNIALAVSVIAFYGGFGVQWFNDHIYAKYCSPFLLRLMGISNQPQQVVRESSPFAAQTRDAIYSSSNLSEGRRTFRF